MRLSPGTFLSNTDGSSAIGYFTLSGSGTVL